MMYDGTSLLDSLRAMQEKLGAQPIQRVWPPLAPKRHSSVLGIDFVTSPIVHKNEIWMQTDTDFVRIANIGVQDES